MGKRILLYGATGFSGSLIAAEAAARLQGEWAAKGIEVVLASRDARRLALLAARVGLDWTAFGLDDRTQVLRALRGFDVVVNAAGPFAFTGERLAKSCIATNCHYVDINGEVEVYKRLDDLERSAQQRGVTLVCGAGQTATVSDMLLQHALEHLKDKADHCTVRIAVARMAYFSRGSAQTMMRAIREQVLVVRGAPDSESTNGWRHRLTHVPVGRLERTFDFTLAEDAKSGVKDPRFGPRIAAAANLIDTLTARRTAEQLHAKLDTVESYIEMPGVLRLGYQLGALSSVFFAMPWVRRLNRLQIDQLPEGPDKAERATNRHRVLLEVESAFREILIDWRLETPDPYEFTARSVLAVAGQLACGAFTDRGWQTPAAVVTRLTGPKLAKLLTAPPIGGQGSRRIDDDPFRDCRFQPVRTAATAARTKAVR